MDKELDSLLQRLHNNPIFSKTEEDAIRAKLGDPIIQKYFEVLSLMSYQEFMQNEADTSEAEIALLSRFKKLKGIHYVCLFIKNNYGKGNTNAPAASGA